MELVGYLSDAQGSLAKQERGFHEEQLVDVIDYGTTTGYLTNDSREIGRGNA